MLKPMLLTDTIRNGLDRLSALVDAEVARDPQSVESLQLQDANRWIRYQLERNRIERQRKSAQRARASQAQPESKPLPPNTPPVKWPSWRLEESSKKAA